MSPSPQRPASGRPDYSKNASLVIIGLVYTLATVAGIITFKITSPGLHAMTALFLFISIPMMERRQLQNKPGYADYKKSTRMLI